MDLGSSDRLAMVSEKCIHSVAWPNLSPDPLIKVMEEPAVELPLLDGPGISSQPGTNWSGNSVENCVGSWYTWVL